MFLRRLPFFNCLLVVVACFVLLFRNTKNLTGIQKSLVQALVVEASISETPAGDVVGARAPEGEEEGISDDSRHRRGADESTKPKRESRARKQKEGQGNFEEKINPTDYNLVQGHQTEALPAVGKEDSDNQHNNASPKAEIIQQGENEQPDANISVNTNEGNHTTGKVVLGNDNLKQHSTSASNVDRSDLLTIEGLRKGLEEGKAKLREKMKELYGGYYETMFEPDGVNVGHHYFHKTPSQYNLNPGKQTVPNEQSTSWNRLVHKLQIKLLEMQLGVLNEKLGTSDPGTKKHYSQFLWMTSGDSAAAGIGNLWHQSFTAVLQEAARETFGRLGIDFIARNHGLQKMSSAPEVALCSGALFGTEYDAIVWEFTWQDNKDTWKQGFYAHRTAISSKKRPALFLHSDHVGVGHKNTKGTLQVLKKLEELGMPVFINDPKAEATLIQSTPDSVSLSDQEVKTKLPPNLQFFRCGTGIEHNHKKKKGRGTGMGNCGGYQHDTSVCRNRFGMRDWFAGWKVHAIKGYSYAMTMLQILAGAIDRMESVDTKNLERAKEKVQLQLDALLKTEQEEYKLGSLKSSPVVSIEEQKPFNLTALFHSPAICRTTLMPSDTRLRGIFSNRPVPYGEGYQIDATPKTIVSFESPSNILPVVSQQKRACKEPSVEAVSDRVFRDYFMATPKNGKWEEITIPNDSEQAHFDEFDVVKAKGWIIMCVQGCEKKCPEKMILSNSLSNDQVQIEMEVNGVVVSGLAGFITGKSYCRALKHNQDDEEKQFVWTPNKEGRYNIRIQTKGGSLKITSFILL